MAIFANYKKIMIKLIILDMYGVVTRGSYKETCQWLGKKYQRDWKELYAIIYHKYFNQAALGKLSEREFFTKALRELNIPLSWQEISAKHLSFQLPNKGVAALALRLQKREIKILVLSKNIPPHFNDLRRKYHLDKLFPQMINTYDLKLPKSSPKTICYILKKFKVRPEEVIMIDDQDFNLVEPEKIGVKTILYRNTKQLKKEIRKYL